MGEAGFGELMAFGGVAPELVNGRLAMLGFVACFGAEKLGSLSFQEQVTSYPLPVAATLALISLASFAPKLKGGEMNPAIGWENLKGSMFSDVSSIEMLNGRVAMLGLSVLIAQEAITKSNVF